jgi:hypothetical protein
MAAATMGGRIGGIEHRLSLRYRVSINLSLPLSTADDANRAIG